MYWPLTTALTAATAVFEYPPESLQKAVPNEPLDDCGRSSQQSIYLTIMAVRTIESVREQWTGENECMLTRK